MTTLTVLEKKPIVGAEVFVAPDAWLIGDVTVADSVSIFFGAVLRGDILPIRVGERSNIQEHALLHTTRGRTPAVVGSEVTIGHRAIVHGAAVGDRCLVGMGSIILDEAVVGEECIIAAGAVVTEGKHIPPRSLVVGMPGRVQRKLSDEEVSMIIENAESYVQKGRLYRDLEI